MAKLSATDRKDIRKLMEDKEKQLTQALGKEISSDIAQIKSRLLLKQGYDMNSTQLKHQLDNLQAQKTDLIRSIDSHEVTMELEVQEASLDKQHEEAMTALAMEYARRKDEITEWKRIEKEKLMSKRKADMESISSRKKDLDEKFIQENHPGLIHQLEDVRKKFKEVSEFELSIRSEAYRIAQVTEHSQSRLQFLVSESTISAKQKLLQATTYEEAVELIETIPTVSELIEIMEDPDRGATGLVNRLNPQFQIALPASTTPEPVESVTETPVQVVDSTEECIVEVVAD